MSRLYQIQNEKLTVRINGLGGSILSMKDAAGTEYLWQKNPAYWGDDAPHLFPYIARLTDGTYRFEGKEYQMDIHGFLKDTELAAEKETAESVTLVLKSSEETKRQYPFDFVLYMDYALKADTLSVTYRVENQDTKTMYFGIGGHPGFNVPFDEGLRFEDYALEFAEECEPVRVGMSEDCFVQPENDAALELMEGKRLPLHHTMFDNDAIILRDMGRKIFLKSTKGTKSICVTYPDMPYLGIWHMPCTDAPYVCIEPWSSLPSRKGMVEDLEQQDNLVRLPAGEMYQSTWSIELTASIKNSI